ncbi:hypothetical protein ACFY3W_33595, partial [Streptomyces sp. NPDC000961]
MTAQDRSQDPLEPVHAMNDVSMNGEEPGRPPGIRADSSGLGNRQRRVIEVIRDSVQRRGRPPSMREIGQAVDLLDDLAGHAGAQAELPAVLDGLHEGVVHA